MTQVQAKAEFEQSIAQQARAIASEVGANYFVGFMTQGFLSDADFSIKQISSQATPLKEPLKHLLFSAQTVSSQKHIKLSN
ncbi:MAG: hypothetical protein V7L23_12095 [Nostoc sp.]|uniref:hypothetical protein n=1 Tax=Nostoc sp. TaxID=1180 RepID=UPI002FF02AB9